MARGITELGPLAVAGVEVDVTNLGAPAPTRVRTSLPPALSVFDTLPAASVTGTTTLEWLAQLATGQSTALRSFVRLPDAVGTYTTSTEVASMTGGQAHVVGSFPFDLAVTQSGQDELLATQLVVAALPTRGPDAPNRARILADLSHVQTRTIVSRSSIELNLRDLFDAVEQAKDLRTPTPTRLMLDELIRYQEARWYTY